MQSAPVGIKVIDFKKSMHALNLQAYLANLVVLGESVIVKDGKHERLVKGLSIRQILELKRLVEERIQCLSMDLGLKLLEPLGLGQQVD